MSNEKKYRYVKFEKLSQVAKAWEEGEQIYEMKYNDLVGDSYKIVLAESYLTLFKDAKYYRREEIKPFECWVYVSDRYSKIEADLDASSLDCTESGNGRLIKMREVIE